MPKIQKTTFIRALIAAAIALSACSADAPPETAQTSTPAQTTVVNAPDESSVESRNVPAQPAPDQEIKAASQPSDDTAAETQRLELAEEYVADLGFRPDQHGFSFENYGAEKPVTNLTPVEMRRLFGDQVCARITGDTCVLTPPAKQWMEQANEAMAGGHCEGMAVLSLLLYAGQKEAQEFGADSTPDLQLEDNEALQREIAYWFVTQITEPASSQIIKGRPGEILDALKEAYQPGNAQDTFTIGIYKPDHSGGHAVTAYGLVDKGDGVYWIMVYDNNYPGQDRYIAVDTNSDTWQYEAAVNPNVESELYEGDADTQTLEIVPSTPRLDRQVCPFCGEAEGKGGQALAQTTQRYNEVWMEGGADLLIVDQQGRRLGRQGGQFHREIPKAQVTVFKGGLYAQDVPPMYQLPVGLAFTAVIDGDRVANPDEPVDLIMIGPGYYIGVESITIDPGEKDTLTLSGDGRKITYKTDYAESPTIVIGLERMVADFELELQGTDIKPGTEIVVEVDPVKGAMTLHIVSDEPSKFRLAMSRITDDDDETFEGDDIDLDPNDRLTFVFGEWDGKGKSLKVLYDAGGDGTIDEELDMADQR